MHGEQQLHACAKKDWMEQDINGVYRECEVSRNFNYSNRCNENCDANAAGSAALATAVACDPAFLSRLWKMGVSNG